MPKTFFDYANECRESMGEAVGTTDPGTNERYAAIQKIGTIIDVRMAQSRLLLAKPDHPFIDRVIIAARAALNTLVTAPRHGSQRWAEAEHELNYAIIDGIPLDDAATIAESKAATMESVAPATLAPAGSENSTTEVTKDDAALIALTPNEQAIFDTLTDVPMIGADVLAKLARDGVTNIDESALSRACKRPPMKARGVRHRKGAGYYKIPF